MKTIEIIQIILLCLMVICAYFLYKAMKKPLLPRSCKKLVIGKIQTTDYWEIVDDKNIKTSEIVKKINIFYRFYTFEPDSFPGDLDVLFPPPLETKKYKCLATIESDLEYKGKSYYDIFEQKDIQWMNARQYLILLLQRLEDERQIFDVDGWTILDSTWSDGSAVVGFADFPRGYLNTTFCNYSDPGHGPRRIYPC